MQSYSTKTKTASQILPRGTSSLFFFYETDEVTVESEYVLLDLPALLAAVGGFVGMLLGWSAKDLALLVFGRLDYGWEAYKKRSKRVLGSVKDKKDLEK